MDTENKSSYKKQIFIFLFFVFAAAVGWLLNKMSHDYVRTVVCRLELYNSSDGRFTFTPKNDVMMQVGMSGFSAAGSSIQHYSIKIDLLNKKILQTAGRKYILSAELFSAISEQLGGNKRLISISPDTIFIKSDIKESKRVPVLPNLQLSFKPEYMQKGKTQISPDSIWISGTGEIIDSIKAVYCAPLHIKNISSPVNGMLDIENRTNGLTLERSRAMFKIDVARYSEGFTKSTIQVLNAPDSVNISLFPSEVNIKYRAEIDKFANINVSHFLFTVDYNDFANSINGNMEVRSERKPKDLLNFECSPSYVEAVITHK